MSLNRGGIKQATSGNKREQERAGGLADRAVNKNRQLLVNDADSDDEEPKQIADNNNVS